MQRGFGSGVEAFVMAQSHHSLPSGVSFVFSGLTIYMFWEKLVCHSYEVLVFYTLASLESSMAGIYFVIFVLWSSVSLLLYQSLCYGCFFFFNASYSGCFWCWRDLPVFTLLAIAGMSTPECRKQSPMSTHLTCPLEHHQQHTQDPPCAFSMCVWRVSQDQCCPSQPFLPFPFLLLLHVFPLPFFILHSVLGTLPPTLWSPVLQCSCLEDILSKLMQQRQMPLRDIVN